MIFVGLIHDFWLVNPHLFLFHWRFLKQVPLGPGPVGWTPPAPRSARARRPVGALGVLAEAEGGAGGAGGAGTGDYYWLIWLIII